MNGKSFQVIPERPVEAGEYIAVYGEFMQYLCQFTGVRELRGTASLVGACWLQGSLFAVEDNAGMVPSVDGQVLGELYKIHDPAGVRWCDVRVHEDCDATNRYFERRYVNLIEPEVQAWVYVWGERSLDNGRAIANGDWRSHVDERTAALMLAA